MLGSKIKEYMDDRGIKYGRIAENAGISPQIFSAMLNEKRRITAEEYFNICHALGEDCNRFAPPKVAS